MSEHKYCKFALFKIDWFSYAKERNQICIHLFAVCTKLMCLRFPNILPPFLSCMVEMYPENGRSDWIICISWSSDCHLWEPQNFSGGEKANKFLPFGYYTYFWLLHSSSSNASLLCGVGTQTERKCLDIFYATANFVVNCGRRRIADATKIVHSVKTRHSLKSDQIFHFLWHCSAV